MIKGLKAVIPIAGWGKRLRPHTFSLPKVMLMVAGKPMIAHILDRLQGMGIEEVIFVAGHLKEIVEEYVRANYSFKVTFVEQKELLGLGHAIYLTKKVVKDSPVFIILGDTIIDADFESMLEENKSFIGVKHVEDPRRFGVVKVHNDYITEMIEKPKKPVSHMAIVGVYYLKNSKLLFSCLEETISKDIRTQGEYQLTDALQRMLKKKEKIAILPIDAWYDCGTVKTILETNKILLKKENKSCEIKTCTIIPPVSIHKSAKIKNSVIGPFVTIGDDAIIQDSVIRNSIVYQRAVIKNKVLTDSLVGIASTIEGKKQKINIGEDVEIQE